jgi:hypothetical protein
MTSDGDSRTRIVLSWLREDAHENAEHALLRALDEVETTPQRRSWRPARRSPAMNAYAKLAIAAAAVLLVAIVGYRFLPSNSVTGGAPTAAPSQASAPPSASPSASAVGSSQIPEGSITAGTYDLDSANGVTVDIPVGWSGCCGGGVITKADAAGNDIGGILYFEDVADIDVYNDPCHWSLGQTKPRGVAAIAAALSAQPTRQGSKPQDVTVASLPGVHVRLTVPSDIKVTAANGDFTDCDQGQFRSWTSGHGATRYHQTPSQIDDVYLIPVGSRILAFDIASRPDIGASDKADLAAMLASVRIAQR